MEEFIVRTLVDYGYVAVFLLMMLQGAGVPIPSEVTMALGGAAASSTFVAATLGDASQPLSLMWVIVAGVLGDLAGSWIAYGIGRIGGRPFVRRWGGRIFRREHEVERAERWFARHGERAVFVSKLLPIARSYISFPAGVAEMQPFRFSLFVVLGTLPFAIGMALLGYAFGDEVIKYLRPIAYAVAAVLAVAVAWWLIRQRRSRRGSVERTGGALRAHRHEPVAMSGGTAGTGFRMPLRRRIARAAQRDDIPRPPGPRRGVPGAGLAAMRRDPLGMLLSVARDHGDIAYMRLGPFDVYIVSHPDDIREVLVTNNRSYMKGRGLQEAKRVIGEGLLTSEGEFHRTQRRLIQPIFHHSRIDGYGEAMVADAVRLTDRWQDGELLNIHAEMMRLTMVIVGATLFGADVEGDAADVGAALTDVLQMFQRVSSPFGPLLDRLPLPSTKRYQRAQATLDRVIERMIAERRAEGATGADLLSMLIAAQDEESGAAMSDRQVRDEAMTLFLAGHETTAQLMTWTWYLLSRSAFVESRLHAELDQVLGGRLPTVADIAHLPYTEMILTEAMRMYPPAYALGRLALEDVRIRGFDIPEGSTILMSPYVVHHDPRWYLEPFRFDPGRWSAEEVSKRPRTAFFPFGGGPRLCIGEGFAWMESKLLLATIAQRWQLRVPPSHPVDLQPMVTLRPRGGMPARVERRAARAPAPTLSG